MLTLRTMRHKLTTRRALEKTVTHELLVWSTGRHVTLLILTSSLFLPGGEWLTALWANVSPFPQLMQGVLLPSNHSIMIKALPLNGTAMS